MFDQPPRHRRRFLGLAALSLAGAWIGTRDSVQLITMKPFRPSGASDLASLRRATAWLNSPPLTSAELQGKVVLVDFWTYTCINWLRTVPYVRMWADRYKEHGLVVIGVHTPEFTFEEDVNNVRRSANERGVTYPIAIDNDRAIWGGFGNHYWPALFFVDRSGRVREHHFGEGNYEESEMRIRELLAIPGSKSGLERQPGSLDAYGPEAGADWGNLKSPETYVGYHKAENFASPGGAVVNTRHAYAVPPRLRLNQWALSGEWTLKTEAASLNAGGGRIAFRFHARDLHLIMGPVAPRGAVPFRVTIDGRPPGAGHGSDVDEQGNGTVTEQRLYQLIRQSGSIADRQFEIEFLNSGVEAFAFTFG
jgi:thiol-disulfide isomerase/thioredoxin